MIGGIANYVRDSRLEALLSGKRVALIGPARTMMHRRLGRQLSEYDLIARVNEIYPFEWQADYGNRTDIVCHSFGEDTISQIDLSLRHNAFIAQQLKFFVMPQLSGDRLRLAASVNRDPRRYGRANRVPFHHIGDQFWHEIAAALGSSPNTGFATIKALLQYDLTELFICGISFYRDGNKHTVAHYPAYMMYGGDEHKLSVIKNMHNQEPQITAFKKIVSADNRIRLDTNLSRFGKDRVISLTPSALVQSHRKLRNLMAGRRVAIVGPAGYIDASEIGELIDSYDVVVRINHVEPGDPAKHGTRTDIAFTATGPEQQKYIASRAHSAGNVFVVAVCDADQNVSLLADKYDIDTIDRVEWHELGREIGWSPNTGMAAIAFIVEHCYPAETFITGISFYQQGQRKEARHSTTYARHPEYGINETISSQSGRYNQEPQRRWFSELCARCPDIIRTDQRLAAIAGLSDIHTIAIENGPRPLKYAIYRAYYGEDYIRQSIESVRKYVDKIFVFWTDRAFAEVTGYEWNGKWISFPRPPDRLCEIIHELASDDASIIPIYDHYGQPDGQWSHLINKRLLPEHERPAIVVCMEPDMVWHKDDIAGVITDAMKSDPGTIVAVKQVELWRDHRHVVERERPRIGPVVYRLTSGDVPVTGKNAMPLAGGNVVVSSKKCYNFGFCVSESSMLLKHLTALAFSKKIRDSQPNESWYEEKWLNWTEDTKDLEIAIGYEHTIKQAKQYDGPLPEVI